MMDLLLLKIKKVVKINFSTTFRKKSRGQSLPTASCWIMSRVSAHHRQIGAKVIKIPVIIAA